MSRGRRVRGPHASRRRFPPVEVFGIPGRDHVGRKEVRLPDVRSKFGGDHSQRGRFQRGGNGALGSTREGREQEAHHEDRERAACAESEAVVRSESETERDNLADHRGRQLVDELLPTHNRISSAVAFVSNRGRDNSSDRAILLGDSPCEGVRTVINHLWSIRGRESTTCGLFGSRAVSTLKCDDLVRRDEVF